MHQRTSVYLVMVSDASWPRCILANHCTDWIWFTVPHSQITCHHQSEASVSFIRSLWSLDSNRLRKSNQAPTACMHNIQGGHWLPPHLQYIATLPYEIWKSTNVTKFLHWTSNECWRPMSVVYFVYCISCLDFLKSLHSSVSSQHSLPLSSTKAAQHSKKCTLSTSTNTLTQSLMSDYA